MSATTASLTVLLVDDDQMVLNAISRLIARAGHRVIGCTNAQNAREQLAHTPVDVVITDWHLGVEDGADLIKELRIRMPEIRIVVLSGNVESVPGELRVQRLRKPAGIIELLSAIKGEQHAPM